MPAKKLSKAMKIGDEFFRERVDKGAHFRLNALMVIIIILAVMLVYDALDLLLIHLYFSTQVQVFTSVFEIAIVVVLGLLAYKFTRDLHEWEHTYRKVREVLR
jgi:hypothetical protein